MRSEVEMIGWLNLCFFLFTFFAFLFTTCISIIFFSSVLQRIYVLSLLFLVYSVHINLFFFPIVRIYILSLFFFFLQCAHQSFFSSISYCKNLRTFIKIKINLLIVLESIIICFICFIGYFYHKRTRHTDKPNCFSQKNTKRIRICILFLYLSPLFWQCHCHKPITIISPLFRQWHYHKPTATIFFLLLFRQCHCHKSIPQFFFFRDNMCTQFLQQILSGRLLLVVIVGLKK